MAGEHVVQPRSQNGTSLASSSWPFRSSKQPVFCLFVSKLLSYRCVFSLKLNDCQPNLRRKPRTATRSHTVKAAGRKKYRRGCFAPYFIPTQFRQVCLNSCFCFLFRVPAGHLSWIFARITLAWPKRFHCSRGHLCFVGPRLAPAGSAAGLAGPSG